MKEPERDPVLRLVDLVLGDLAVRSAMFVGRRPQDGDSESFVIQTGEEGRHRVRLPDLDSRKSIEMFVAAAQRYLEEVLGAPVPRCPEHDHALVGTSESESITWTCPESGWRCEVGDYEAQTWPQLDASSKLAEILSRRLRRRGTFPTVRTIRVSQSGDEWVADFGLVKINDELIRILTNVTAPLRVQTHESPNDMIRTSLSD